MLMAYAKGARTFERHIDYENMPITTYSSLPHQIDTWFKAYHKAREMCGASGTQKRIPPEKEIRHLDTFVRGVYARQDLPAGHVIPDKDVYLAVPLQKGQISCRELMWGEVLLKPCAKGKAIQIDMIDSPYANNESLKKLIYERGI
ncbi:hypothetical protein AUJ13_04285 [Candidatus Micrarchaeota archaeon CG1_02_49_24]|nr:MAG: hypothetical protein AUJ13_04285 [Candidatus Micrarchaeota archaeon CG1_02_49_24]HII54158.1 hypothetical protein [Candidatus Micrarchaeota archaeon]